MLNDQKLRSLVKPTCFVSFPRQSVLLERYIHVVGRVPVVFMRGKCMEAIDPGHVLENCAVCLVFRGKQPPIAVHCEIPLHFGTINVN